MMPVLPPRQVPGNGAFGSIRGVLRPELHRTVLLGEVTLKLGLPERKGESGKVEELAGKNELQDEELTPAWEVQDFQSSGAWGCQCGSGMVVPKR